MNKKNLENLVNLPKGYTFTFVTERPESARCVRTLEELNPYLAALGHKPVHTFEELEARYSFNCLLSITNELWERLEPMEDQREALIKALTAPMSEDELIYDSLCAICGGAQVNGICPRIKDRTHQELLGTYDEEEREQAFAEIMGLVRERGFERATFAHILLDLYGWTPEQAIAHIEALGVQAAEVSK